MSFRTSSLPRKVRAVAAARAISFLGDEVALIAMAFRAKAYFGHYGVMAILIAGVAPLLVLSPVSGLLVDRVRSRPLLVAVGALQAGLCAALAFSDRTTLLPLIFALGCATAISSPAWQSLVPTMVDDEQLPGAMGLLQSLQAAAGLAGPALGGLLVGWYGFHVPLVVDAGSFAILALAPVVLRLDRRPDTAGEPATRRAALAGFALIARSPMLRSLVVLAVLFVLTLGMINVVELFFVVVDLHAGPLGYGLLGTSFAVGLLAAGLASARLARRWPRPEVLFVAGCAVLVAGIGSFALVRSVPEAMGVLVVAGAANALVNVNVGVLLTRASHDAIRGRVFAAVQGTVGAAQLGSLLLGGLLLGWLSPRSIILVSAAACTVVMAATVAPVLRVRPQPAAGELDAVAA